jgi:gamma-glutamyl-gamma-aminobutyrate hydrolase PuuD
MILRTRQNLTPRMANRRFTRLTNAFSKRIESQIASIALHYMHYNFVRIHQTLRVTPAMAAGLSDHVWELSELIRLLDGIVLPGNRRLSEIFFGPKRLKYLSRSASAFSEAG